MDIVHNNVRCQTGSDILHFSDSPRSTVMPVLEEVHRSTYPKLKIPRSIVSHHVLCAVELGVRQRWSYSTQCRGHAPPHLCISTAPQNVNEAWHSRYFGAILVKCDLIFSWSDHTSVRHSDACRKRTRHHRGMSAMCPRTSHALLEAV